MGRQCKKKAKQEAEYAEFLKNQMTMYDFGIEIGGQLRAATSH